MQYGWIASIWITAVVLVGTSLIAQNNYVPKDGYVPDAKTAVKIGEAVLEAIYGEDQIAKERPFSAELENDRWIVRGHLPETQNRGGVSQVELSKSDARILRLTHGR